MLVYSMTGYASIESPMKGFVEDIAKEIQTLPVPTKKTDNGSVNVELRSVNSRFLDIHFKLAEEFRHLEPQLRKLICAAIHRGKIELRLAASHTLTASWPTPTQEQLNALSRLENQVKNWLPQANGLSVNEIMHWCQQNSANEKPDNVALQAVAQCLQTLKEARAMEGQRMVVVLNDRVQQLRTLVQNAKPMVPLAVIKQQERFMQRFKEAWQTAGKSVHGAMTEEIAIDKALNESAAFALRIDVDEELERLKAHLDEIERLLTQGGEVGKRLDFLIQELHREANTMGAKSAMLELTQISMNMKVLIEQMREQVQNIE